MCGIQLFMDVKLERFNGRVKKARVIFNVVLQKSFKDKQDRQNNQRKGTGKKQQRESYYGEIQLEDEVNGQVI